MMTYEATFVFGTEFLNTRELSMIRRGLDAEKGGLNHIQFYGFSVKTQLNEYRGDRKFHEINACF